MENVRSICAGFLLVPGRLTWIVFIPIFREKVVEMERAQPRGNFHLGFVASHLQQLSTNRFFRVNGRQPLVLFAVPVLASRMSTVS